MIMIYRCECCGAIIDPDHLQTEKKVISICPYCGQSKYKDFRSGVSVPAVRNATKEETTGYEKMLNRLSEEREERISFSKDLIASNKERIRQTFGSKKAQEFEMCMQKKAEGMLYDNLPLNLWKQFLQKLVSDYSRRFAMTAIKHTQKK